MSSLLNGLNILSTALAGFIPSAILGLSAMAIPAILILPQPEQSKAFSEIYRRGSIIMPSLSAVTATLLVTVHYAIPLENRAGSLRLYTAASMLAIVPFTAIFMLKVVDKSKAGNEGSTRAIRQWSVLNVIRALFPLTGFLLHLIHFKARL
ncbi:DUF1772 domain-containing protein [Dipodascopsis uninucleata]